jgi:ferredoxin-NADP reductase
MKVWFERRTELTPTVWEYSFRTERPVDFVPGQYVGFTLPGVEGDSRGARRVFTLTSLPSEELARFVVKIPQPHTPYKEVLIHLPAGTECKIDDAMGDLILPKSPAQPLVYVAGGIGIASYASMLKQLLATREERPIYFFYALRSRTEQIFRELTDSYPLQLKQVILAPNRLSAKEIRDTTPPDSFIYLSGSQRFTEGLRTDLEALGTPRSSIVFDYYDGYTEDI